MRLPPTPCRVCFRPRVFNKFSHFWQKKKRKKKKHKRLSLPSRQAAEHRRSTAKVGASRGQRVVCVSCQASLRMRHHASAVRALDIFAANAARALAVSAAWRQRCLAYRSRCLTEPSEP